MKKENYASKSFGIPWFNSKYAVAGFLLMLCLSLHACKKEKINASPDNSKGHIAFDILKNGNSKHFDYVEPIGYTFHYIDNYMEPPYIAIFIRKHMEGAIYEEFAMTIPDSTRGSYSFGPGRGLSYRLYNSSTGVTTNYDSDPANATGQLVLDSVSRNYVKGSFNVTCWNGTEPAVLTNGQFWGLLYE